KNHSKKSPPLNPCKLSFCPIFREYRKPYSASKKIYSSFGVKFYRTKPLNKKRHENNLSYLLYLIYIFFSNKLPVYFFHFVICQKSFFHFQIFFIAQAVHNRIDIFLSFFFFVLVQFSIFKFGNAFSEKTRKNHYSFTFQCFIKYFKYFLILEIIAI